MKYLIMNHDNYVYIGMHSSANIMSLFYIILSFRFTRLLMIVLKVVFQGW